MTKTGTAAAAKAAEEAPMTAVQERQETLPATLMDLVDQAGTGFEEARPEDYAIPFLRIIQSGSPELKKAHAKYREDAREGMILNTSTGELYDGDSGVFVVPVHFVPRLLEWKPRDQGGGFAGSYPANDPIKQKTVRGEGKDASKLFLPNGNLLSETAQHTVIQLSAEGEVLGPAVVALTSTQLKKSRAWLAMAARMQRELGGKLYKPSPSFFHVYQLTTIPETYAGGDCMGWRIECVGDAPLAAIEAAAKLKVGLNSGAIKTQDVDLGDTTATGATPTPTDHGEF